MNKNERMVSKRSQVLPFLKIFTSALTEWTTENEAVYQNMTRGGWYILRKESDTVFIRTGKGEIVEVRADGTSGYFFAVGYLKTMSRHYQGHLQAMDALLRLLEDKAYISGAAFPKLYLARLAVQSLNCCFGGSETEPDADEAGELHPKTVECPIRARCKFCGIGHRKAKRSGCNPVYELDLSPRQLELAGFLVNSRYGLFEIALEMGLTEGYVRKKASEIYERLKVADRNELRLFLQNKRLS